MAFNALAIRPAWTVAPKPTAGAQAPGVPAGRLRPDPPNDGSASNAGGVDPSLNRIPFPAEVPSQQRDHVHPKS